MDKKTSTDNKIALFHWHHTAINHYCRRDRQLCLLLERLCRWQRIVLFIQEKNRLRHHMEYQGKCNDCTDLLILFVFKLISGGTRIDSLYFHTGFDILFALVTIIELFLFLFLLFNGFRTSAWKRPVTHASGTIHKPHTEKSETTFYKLFNAVRRFTNNCSTYLTICMLGYLLLPDRCIVPNRGLLL